MLAAVAGMLMVGLLLVSMFFFFFSSRGASFVGMTPTAEFGDSIGDPFTRIDEALRETLSTRVSYRAPHSMDLNETVTVELALDAGEESLDLGEPVDGSGEVITAKVEVTPRTKAELISQEEGAFVIQPLHGDPEQFISTTEATRWEWDVTPRRGGPQRLTLVIYRLITVDGIEDWRQVAIYRTDVEVQVTWVQRIMLLDWRWIAGFVGILAVTIVLGLARRKPPLPAGAWEKRGRGAPVENLGRIFISYRRSDSADITGRIYDCLVAEFGRDLIFKDVDSIPLGIDFKEYLDRKVSECRVALAIIGDHWLDARDPSGNRRLEDPADFVRLEIASALARGIPVIPLLVRGAGMPAEKSLPPDLRKLVYKNGIPIRPDPDFHRDMDRLIAALNKYIV
jgi:hypothetical protein